MNISYKILKKSFTRGFIFTAICALFCVTTQSNAQVVVEMKLDTAEILVGQQVQLSTIVSANASQDVKFPDLEKGEELVKGLEIVDESPVDTTFINDNKRIQLLHKFTVTAFDSAIYTIPPMEVLVDGDTVRANGPVGLKVNTIPVDTTKLDAFAGPHTVVPEAFLWKNHLVLKSLVLWVCLILIVLLSVKLTIRKPLTTKRVIKSQTPPNKQARTAIEQLNADSVREQIDAKKFHMALTDALRVYLQRRFNIQAMEQTTEEILDAVKDHVNEQSYSELKFIFETADLVKFAKYMTSEFEMTRCLNAATNFLKNTVDEDMENPQPIVEIIVLNDGMQHKFRLMLWGALTILILGSIGFAYYLSKMITMTFL